MKSRTIRFSEQGLRPVAELYRSTEHDMRTFLLIIVTLVVSGVARAQNEVPTGKLGFPLGTYLTVEGEAAKGGFKVNPTCTLVVDTVNGKRLQRPVSIVVENLNMKDPLPQQGRVVIKGYESGKMIGTPPGAIEAAKEAGKNIPLPQAGWQFYRSFVLTSWVHPERSESQKDKVESDGAANAAPPHR